MAILRFRVARMLPAAGAVQIDPAGTGTQPYVSRRLRKKAPQDWWIVDDGSSATGRFARVAQVLGVYCRQPPGGECGRELQNTVVSSQFKTRLFLKRSLVFSRFPIPLKGRRLKWLCARDPDGAGGHLRAAGCLRTR
eukprot:6192169-Pleurochrysis_carterae.AAC.2